MGGFISPRMSLFVPNKYKKENEAKSLSFDEPLMKCSE